MSIGGVLRWIASFERPVFAGTVVFLTLGSVGLYAYFVETLPPLPAFDSDLVVAEGKFDVEITLTFDARSDAFQLEPTSVLVRLEREEIRLTETIRAGRPVLVEGFPNVRVGENEFFVQVFADDASGGSGDEFSLNFDNDTSEQSQSFAVARAVRVRILRDGLPIAEQSLWSEPGQPVAGPVPVVVPGVDSHDHAH